MAASSGSWCANDSPEDLVAVFLAGDTGLDDQVFEGDEQLGIGMPEVEVHWLAVLRLHGVLVGLSGGASLGVDPAGAAIKLT